MELTKQKVLEVLANINMIENVVSQGGDKYQINSNLSYCFMKNKRKIKKVTSEQEDIIKFLREEFDKSYVTEDFTKEDFTKKLQEDKAFKEDYDKAFQEEVEKSEKYKEFLDEKTNITFYKIKEEKIEGVILLTASIFLERIYEYIIEEE